MPIDEIDAEALAIKDCALPVFWIDDGAVGQEMI
jgi:hypothetical protein